MIAAAHQTMMGPPALPYDAEVEYLESTGTQYIDTGIGLAAGSFRCHASVDTTYTQPCNVFVLKGDATSGNTNERRVLFLFQVGGDGYIDRGTAGGRISFSGADYDTGKIAFSIQLNAGSTKHFGAFGTIGGNSAYFLRGKMYLLQIWDDNGVLVRDFIPVRKNGVGYLFDKVGRKLFGNAGTGSFVLGPDK